MKKFYALFIALLVASSAMTQTDAPCESCLPDGIAFETQSQIDSFPINYPNCTEIEGHVFIGSGINNLNGLSNLTSIGGGVSLNYAQITSFEGLENITLIDGELWMKFTSLTSFDGLNNLTSIMGDFSVGQNSYLISFDGLDNLTSIGGNFSVWDNNVLSSYDGLENLISIGGYLEIGGGWDGNPVLTSISGLRNISSIGTNLYIRDNLQLSDCAIQSICDYLVAPNGDIIIEGNASGCTNSEEILDSCEAHAGLIDAQILASKLLICPNPSSSTITIELPAQLSNNAFLAIYNTQGQQFITQPITKPKTEINISHLPAGVYIVKVWGRDGVMTGKVLVE